MCVCFCVWLCTHVLPVVTYIYILLITVTSIPVICAFPRLLLVTKTPATKLVDFYLPLTFPPWLSGLERWLSKREVPGPIQLFSGTDLFTLRIRCNTLRISGPLYAFTHTEWILRIFQRLNYVFPNACVWFHHPWFSFLSVNVSQTKSSRPYHHSDQLNQ